MSKPPALPIQSLNSQNPFPGLRPFEEREAGLFFGREREITTLLGRVMRQHFLAVLGSSGCGKSSLIKAGLIPSLKYEQMDDGEAAWRIAAMQPGDDPFKRLATALTAEQALGKFGHKTEGSVPIMQMILRRGALGIVEAVRETGLPAEAKLLILVDQFEEIFRFPSRAGRAAALDEARAFINLLLAAAAQRDLPIYVVLTMRSEFLGQCAAFSGLAEAITEGIYLLPDMTRDQLREVIQQPIEKHHGQITERLVNRLLNDLGRNADQLPILQHALMRLWEHWIPRHGEGAMDLQHYEFIGEVTGSLSAHAEKIYEELKSDRERELAQSLFRNLTATTAEGQTVRNPTKLNLVCRRAGATVEEMRAVINQFRAEGRSFLMPPIDTEIDGETTMDISHESLVRQWQRLSEWAEKEAKELKVFADLKRAAASWRENERNSDWLYTGLRLGEAQEWAAAHPALLDDDDLAKQFLADSAEMRKYAGLLLRSQKWNQEGRDSSFLLRGNELQEADQWLAQAQGQTPPARQEVKDTAGTAVLRTTLLRQEVKDLVAASHKANKKLRRLSIGLTIVFLLLIGMSLYANRQQRIAERQQEAAKDAERLAREQQKFAEAEKKRAQVFLTGLAGTVDAQQAMDASTQIQELYDDISARQFIRVRYFYKPSDGTKVPDSLKTIGYKVESLPAKGITPTNAIWWGRGIKPQDLKLIAYRLILNGLQIRYIGQESAADQITIGGRPASVNSPVWTVDRIRALTELPHDND